MDTTHSNNEPDTGPLNGREKLLAGVWWASVFVFAMVLVVAGSSKQFGPDVLWTGPGIPFGAVLAVLVAVLAGSVVYEGVRYYV